MEKKMKEILFLEPVFKEMIWGGNRMKAEYQYPIPSDHTGECWAISAHPNGDCKISNGTYKGQSLSQLWEEHKELFGGLSGDRFPLLIKIIDAKQDLSIQVHPNDIYAKEHENGSLGKTECWYILDCEEGTEIVIGHHAKDKEEVKDMIEQKRWKDFIRTVPLKKGDFFQINPGCVHAIKGGTLILETQQNSDITYRVYDYDRLSNGKPRELHVEKSIAVIEAPFEEVRGDRTKKECDGYTIEHLVSSPYYTVEKVDITKEATFSQTHSFQNISIIDGEGEINGNPIKKGDHFILPAEFGSYTIKGEISYITSYVEK